MLPQNAAHEPSPLADTRLFAWALAGLLLLTWCVFSSLLNGHFVFWDDMVYISGNPMVSQGLNPGTIRWAFGSNLLFFDGLLEYFSPLTALSRLADTSLFGAENPAAFHRTNLLFHLLNVALAASFLRRVTRRTWPSLAVAAIFALHPFTVEPVGWLSARKDLIYGTAFLITLLVYGWYVEKPGWRRYLPLAAAFGLACLAKPMVVTLPCVLLLLDFWPLNRFTLPPRLHDLVYRRQHLGLLLEKVPLFLASIGVAVLAVKSQAGYSAIVPLSVFGWEDRIGNMAAGYLEYLQKFFVPLDFAPLHRFIHDATIWNTVPRLAALAALCALIIWKAPRLPWLFTGWFWFVGILLPVSGIMQVGAARIAERYMYVPLIGLALCVVWGAMALSERWQARFPAIRPALVGLYLGWMLILMITARCLTQTWHDSMTLADRQLALYPESWNFRRAFGDWLALHHQPDLAWAHGHEMLAANQYPGSAWHRIAGILYERGQMSLAIDAATKSLDFEPENLEVHSLLGLLLSKDQRPAEAIPHFEKVERAMGGHLNPTATFLLLRAYLETGQSQAAEAEFNQLQSAARTDPEARRLLQSLAPR